MFVYPKVLRAKDLKKISRYSCSDEVKDAYIKYLTNYSFNEFAGFCEENDGDMQDLIFKFTDLQLEKFEPNSLIWISHVLINFLIYFNVNLYYEEYYDAYASILQFSVLYSAMDMLINRISFGEVELSQYSKDSFDKFFTVCPDFRFNLKTDCDLAYRSFNQNFDFTGEEFYHLIKNYLDKN